MNSHQNSISEDANKSISRSTLAEELTQASEDRGPLQIRQEADHYLSRSESLGFLLASYSQVEDSLCCNNSSYWGGKDVLPHHTTILFHNDREQYLHRYDGYELVFVLEGVLEQQLEWGVIAVKKNELLIMNPNVVHSDRYAGEAMVAFLTVPEAVMQEIQADCVLAESTRSFFAPQKNREASPRAEYYHYAPAKAEALRSLLDQIYEEKTGGLAGSQHMVLGLLSRLLAEIDSEEEFRRHRITQDKHSSLSVFIGMEKLLEKNRWAVSDTLLTEKLHYSSQRLNQIMKQYTGLSVKKYCVEKKLTMAAELLNSSEMSINEIIMHLGYENRSYFYRIFGEKYGVTPQEYRMMTAIQPNK